MALRNVRTSKTTTRKSEVIVKSVKQTPKKTPERIAKEAKYNADLEVYNKSKADQSSAESEYSSSMAKYNENMKTYNDSKVGTPYESMWGASLNKEQLSRFNAQDQKLNPGGMVSSKIRVRKGADTEAFTKNYEKNTDRGSGWYLPEYVKPSTPEKRKTTSVSEPVQDWEEEILPMKITSVSTKKGKLIPAKEDVTWEAPVMTEKKGSRMGYTKIKPGGKTGIKNAAHPFNEKAVGPNKIKYNTEKRQSAAYYGDSTSTGEPITGKTESELRGLKKETRGEFGRMLKEGRLGDALTVEKDLSQIRKATRYVKKEEGNDLRYFTPDAMSGYKEFQTQEKGKAFRAQYENATNRNNIATQQAKLNQAQLGAAAANASPTSFYTTRGQMKDKYKENNPTASPRQVRQGVRAEIAANKQLIKSVASKQKEKQ